MTIKALLQWGQKELKAFDSAHLDVELLLSEILKEDRPYLMAHDEEKVTLLDVRRFRYLVKKRKTGLPMAYILGKKEFYGLEFKVNKHVLIPRPDTEILLEAVIKDIQPNEQLLDVGTGTGCIPISVLKNKPHIKAIATDVSKKALAVAEENAKLHGVEGQIEFLHSDLLQKVTPNLLQHQEVVLTANLPYVPKDYSVNEEAEFEPESALYTDDGGLLLYKKLLIQAEKVKPRAIFLECYEFQIEPLKKSIKRYEVKEVKKMLGEARLLVLERTK